MLALSRQQAEADVRFACASVGFCDGIDARTSLRTGRRSTSGQ